MKIFVSYLLGYRSSINPQNFAGAGCGNLQLSSKWQETSKRKIENKKSGNIYITR